MTDRHWIPIASCDSVPPREGRLVRLGEGEIALFNLGDRFLAVDNRCPHRGGPLADGIVAGASVVCPLHAWKINLEHGRVERPASANACVATYPVRVAAGVVFLGLPDETAALPGRSKGEAA